MQLSTHDEQSSHLRDSYERTMKRWYSPADCSTAGGAAYLDEHGETEMGLRTIEDQTLGTEVAE